MQNKVLLLPQIQIQIQIPKSTFTISGTLVKTPGERSEDLDLLTTTMTPVPVIIFDKQVSVIRLGGTERSSSYNSYLYFNSNFLLPYQSFFKITFSGDHTGEYAGVFNQNNGFMEYSDYFFNLGWSLNAGDYLQADVECWQAEGLPEATLSVLVKPADIINVYPMIMGYFPDERGIIFLNNQAFNETYLYRTCMNGVLQIMYKVSPNYSISEYSGLEKIGKDSYLITSSNPSIVFVENI